MIAPTLPRLSFDGRLSASRYRQIQRKTGFVLLGGLVVCALASALLIERRAGAWAGAPFVPLVIALGVTSTAFQIRRLHDLGLSGWWTLPIVLGPIVVVTAAVMLKDHLTSTLATIVEAAPLVAVLGLLLWVSQKLRYSKGQQAENRFGPPPQV